MMTIQIDDAVLRDAIEKFGERNQVDVAIEECSELINALEKFRRGRIGRQAVITEIADVEIMCAQLEMIFGGCAPERMMKLDRLRGRINANQG